MKTARRLCPRVLDDDISHLDRESESLTQDALKRVMAGWTSIFIARRLSTILMADLILVMDRARYAPGVVDDGKTNIQLCETLFKNEKI